MFLAETVFQSIDGTLGYIGIVLTVLGVMLLIAVLSVESKLARLIRIQRATYDLIKAMAEGRSQVQLGNEGKDAKLEEKKSPPPMIPTPRQSEATTAPEVYRID